MLRYTMLPFLLMLASCTNEPTRIVPPPTAQSQVGYQGSYDHPGHSNVLITSDDSVWVPVRTETAPSVQQAEVDVQMQEAGDALKQGNNDLYVALLQQAAAGGNAQAHYDLAKVYTDGVVVPRDLGAARESIQESARLGNPEAVRVIGWQMIRGDHGPADVAGGAALIEQAASTSVRAQREAGMLFANLYEQYRLNDVEKGKVYLAMGAHASDAESSYQLGKLHHREGDVISAVPLLSAAAQQGNSKAKTLLNQIDPALSPAPANAETSVQPVSSADPEVLYQKANALILRPARSFDDEALAYAMFTLANEQGHRLAGLELGALSGVRTIMDQREPGWLERTKAAVASGAYR